MGLRFYYFLLIFYFNYVISLNILKSSRNFFLDKKGIETEASTLIGSVIEFVPDFNFQILDKCDNYFICHTNTYTFVSNDLFSHL